LIVILLVLVGVYFVEFLSLITTSSLDLIQRPGVQLTNRVQPALTHWATIRLKTATKDLLAPALARFAQDAVIGPTFSTRFERGDFSARIGRQGALIKEQVREFVAKTDQATWQHDN
jgi:hypothetical protein